MQEQDPEGRVTTGVRGRVLLMGLDRVAMYNGVTPKMFGELSSPYNELDKNPDLWVGVLFAHGPHTTAGLDRRSLLKRCRKFGMLSYGESKDFSIAGQMP